MKVASIGLLALLGPLLGTVDSAAQLSPAGLTLAEGRLLRVRVRDGTLLQGPFAGWQGDTLRLALPGQPGLQVVAAADVLSIWQRARHVRRGLTYGASIGAGGGAAFMTFIGLLVQTMGDSDDISLVGLALAGAGLGAAGGGLVGSAVGAAIPRWDLVWPDRDGTAPAAGPGAPPPASAGVRARRGVTGSLAMAVGLGWSEALDMAQSGLGGSIGLLAEFPSGLGLGPEFGWFDAGRAPQPNWYEPVDPGWPGSFLDETVWFAGGVIRYAPAWLDWDVQPYLLAGLAGYSWQDGFLGGSLGAGVEAVIPRSRVALDLQYRRHDNLQNLVDVDPGFSTITAGVRWAW